MLGQISKIFGPKSYAAQKKIAQTGAIHERLKLAKGKRTHAEILYYLAEKDEDPAVRRAVVANMATPIQATSILVRDPNVDIRVALADRLVNLWPDIGDDAQSQIYAFAVQSLGILALDEVLKIRVALSSALKDFANAPPQVVANLARDVERSVSEPILRYCVALPDEDLIDILRNHPEDWVSEAIAQRPLLSVPVSEGVIDYGSVDAGRLLLENHGIDLSEYVLQHVIDKAKSIPEWQQLIARRKELPPQLAKDLSTFVHQSIRDVLIERSDFDKETIQDIEGAFNRRLKMSDNGDDTRLPAAEDMDTQLCDAIAIRDKVVVTQILADVTDLSVAKIDTILGHQSAKSIVAICWKGNLSMRTALALQKDFVKVPTNTLIYPRGGNDYPLSEKDIQWQLELLGLGT